MQRSYHPARSFWKMPFPPYLKENRAHLHELFQAPGNVAAMRTRKEKDTDPDARLKGLLPLIQGLPEEQRGNVADFLEALVNAHRLIESGADRRRKPKKL
jgi:hypothetical protein